MRSKPTLFCALLWVMAIAVFAGCNKSASVEDFNQAFVESRDEGTIAWNVRADGTVRAMLKSREDKAIAGSMSGKIATDGAPVELTPVEGTGVLEGKGLKLGADLTRAKYNLLVEGKSWDGTLFIPAGGTADLVASAHARSTVKLPEAKVAPHGGSLQVVGNDVVEIVAYAQTGELRVYLFDADLKAVAAADREIKIGLASDAKAELVALVPEPGGIYFTGKMGLNVDPIDITIWSKMKGQAQAQIALIGLQPNGALAVSATAPRVKIMVKADLPERETDVNVRAEVKGAAGVGANANLKTGVDIKPPDVKLKGSVNAAPVQANAGAAAGANVNAGAGAAAKAGAGVGAGVSAGVGAGAKKGGDVKAGSDNTVKSGAKLQVKLP